MGEKRQQVIFAGLLSSAALATPSVARAASLAEVVDDAFASPSLALVAGFAGGVLVTAATGGVVSLARNRASSEDDEEPERSAPRHLRVDAPDDAPSPVSEQKASPSHAALDYEEIAENYVRKVTVRERMARRAEGVAATLRERMGAAMMEGVPVIERADGSVGDVGTSWWTNSVGAASIIADSGFAPDDHELAIPSDFSTTDRERLERAARRAQGIASRIAFVDEGAYPEHRTVEDLDRGDTWSSALRGLDEKIAAIAPAQDEIVFIDSVGDAATLDEPDNLESSTAFMPFKVPGGHPEVVDMSSYVDYLVEDEISKNASTAVRRRFLRVLEGGTQGGSSRHLAGTAPSEPLYVGKHFSAPQAQAAEA